MQGFCNHRPMGCQEKRTIVDIANPPQCGGCKTFMTNCTFAEINSALREHERFAVLGHVRPDGDALGSQLALALSLKQLGKDVRVWNEDGMLEKYSFLSRAELLTKPPSVPEDVDVAIAPRLRPSARRKFGSTSTITRAIQATAISFMSIQPHRRPAKFFSS